MGKGNGCIFLKQYILMKTTRISQITKEENMKLTQNMKIVLHIMEKHLDNDEIGVHQAIEMLKQFDEIIELLNKADILSLRVLGEYRELFAKDIAKMLWKKVSEVGNDDSSK
jgi:hypothetical protein